MLLLPGDACNPVTHKQEGQSDKEKGCASVHASSIDTASIEEPEGTGDDDWRSSENCVLGKVNIARMLHANPMVVDW